ncbi:MAG: xanthine dehydrogenase accessory protein XdhC [Geminicoccaceae bacterium]
MKDWLTALEDCLQAERPSVLVTIADAKGSSPREAGVKMLVTETISVGTVGGGNLEHEAIRLSRAMLADAKQEPALRRFALGPALGQCCGGNTQLLFEPVVVTPRADLEAPPADQASLPADGGPPSADRRAPHEDWIGPLRAFARTHEPSVLVNVIDGGAGGKMMVTADRQIGIEPSPELLAAARDLMQKPGNAGVRLWADSGGTTYLLEQNPGHHGNILLIGAGHVGKALAQVLGPLPFAVTWADNRPDQYPEDIAANILVRCTPHLDRVIDEAPADTIYLVMTYSHDLDYALCARVLQRGDFRYLGLIGSKTKRERFERTMRELGIDQTLIERVVCPIGLEGIGSKLPTVIAVATAAQLLTLMT